MLPFEIVVLGTPIAGQGSQEGRRRWQAEIRSVARERWSETDSPERGPIVFRLAYFFLHEQAADLDNITKVAQDALNGVTYVDDRQIADLIVSARPKEGDYRIDVTPVLARGLAGRSDFVHIVVDHSSAFEAYR